MSKNLWDTINWVQIVQDMDGNLFVADDYAIPYPDEMVAKLCYSSTNLEEYKRHRKEAIGEYMKNLESFTREPKPIKRGYIYAVVCGNKLKLGRTLNPEDRFKSYQRVSNVFKLLAQKEVKDYVRSEKTLLESFGGKVGKNEWLDHSIELENAVLQYFEDLPEFMQ